MSAVAEVEVDVIAQSQPFPVTQKHTHNSGCAVGDISEFTNDLIGR
jgi:hypothetical protein